MDTELITIIDRFARFQNECADLFIDIACQHQPINPKLAAICGDQFNFIAERSNSLIELIKLGAIWDAQILSRPIIESTVKISFICFSPKDQQIQLCREYEEILGEINALKLHDKAIKTLEAASQEVPHPTLAALVLPNAKLEELRVKYPKETRREIESRWGFTRMVVTLDQSFQSNFGIAPFASFFHSYGLSSHLMHADETGLGTIKARNKLAEPKLSVILRSHHVALLDVVAGAAMLSAISIAWAANINLDKALSLTTKHAEVHDGKY